MRRFLILIRDFLRRNLGLLIVIGGYLVPLGIFLIGIKLEWEHSFSPGDVGIENKVLIWVISIPFWIIMLTFIGQAVYYRMDTHREINELKEIHDRRINELKVSHDTRIDELKDSFDERISEIRSYSDIFQVINEVNNKDIYSSTLYGFIIEKLKNDIKSIKDKNFIAEGWYWKLSNKFILHEKNAMCTCVLSPQQLNEPDIHEYFEEQYKAIIDSNQQYQLERILIVDTLNELKNYNDFVSEQINRGVKFFILSKEFPELAGISKDDWEQSFKRDFALIDDIFIIEAKIVNNDLKGYEIRAINGVIPVFAINVRQYRRPVESVLDHFAKLSYNPVKEIITKLQK